MRNDTQHRFSGRKSDVRYFGTRPGLESFGVSLSVRPATSLTLLSRRHPLQLFSVKRQRAGETRADESVGTQKDGTGLM